MNLDGKRALVLGASQGAGRAAALRLAESGARVGLVARNQDRLEETLAEIGGASLGHVAVAADLMKDGEADRALASVQSHIGPLDIVVHTVGGTLAAKDPLLGFDDWRDVWRYNLGLPVDLNRAVLPGMQQRGWGRIVHCSSIASYDPGAAVAYAAVKAALNTYVTNLGRRVAKDGVILSAVQPSIVAHENNNWGRASREKPEFFQKFVSDHIAIGRSIHAEEIGAMMTFLCSDFAAPFAGAILPMDGGWK